MQLGAFLNNPRRVAGVCGLTFLILFVIGGPVLQGTTPTMNDSAEGSCTLRKICPPGA